MNDLIMTLRGRICLRVNEHCTLNNNTTPVFVGVFMTKATAMTNEKKHGSYELFNGQKSTIRVQIKCIRWSKNRFFF